MKLGGICLHLCIFAFIIFIGAKEASAEAGHKKNHPDFVEDEILVKIKNNTNLAEVNNVLQQRGGAVFANAGEFDGIGKLGYRKIKLPKGKISSEALTEFKNETIFETVELNGYCDICLTPNDTRYSEQWSHQKMQSALGWNTLTGASNITIAIVDTGVDYNHEDLSGKVILGYDFVNNDSDPMDDHSHGTHCAGIAAAISNNSKGIAGVSWGARILAVKVLAASGSGTNDQVANGIIYAADHGAKVISLSLGSSSNSQVEHDAVIYAANKGCLIVAARGNNGTSASNYPGSYPECMAISASTSTDALASYSSYGYDVSVAAPGDLILSTVPGSSYATYSGTSMACPAVAGLAALVWSSNLSRTSGQIRQLIQENADDLGTAGYDQYFGNGRINVYKTITALSLPTISIGDAVDNTSLVWTSGGNSIWTGKTTVSYYGGSAAQSGSISDNQSSYIQTSITGPGTLTFYNKVSSENGYDFLRFYIDEVEQSDSISGEINWTQKTYDMPSGNHTIKWAYTKDSSLSSGSDCAWLDKVVFTSRMDNTKDNNYIFPLTGSGVILNVSIPAGTFQGNLILTATTLTIVPASGQNNIKKTSLGAEITLSDPSITAKKNIIVGFQYTHADIIGFDENKLAVGYYDETQKRWVVLDTARNIVANTLFATTTHFSKYAILQLVLAANLDNLVVFPNPFKPGSGGRYDFNGITFGGLTAGAKIKIFSISGGLVRELNETDNDGIYIWDTKNTSNENVASGVYLYLVTDTAGNKKTGKFAVAR